MENKDKAKELASFHAGESDYAEVAVFCAAMEMAEWKDRQIDTILLTMEGCLQSFFESRGNSQESINNFINAIKAQIIKNLDNL